MKISREEVLHVANLARLEFDEDGLGRLAEQLSSILTYVDQLGRLDTSGVEPMAHVHPAVNAFRADEVRPGLPREAALANAPDAEGGCFRVPKVIDG